MQSISVSVDSGVLLIAGGGLSLSAGSGDMWRDLCIFCIFLGWGMAVPGFMFGHCGTCVTNS